MDTYELILCGLTRYLPLVHVGRKTRLANFSFLGDVELVDRLADAMTEELKKFQPDVLVGAEVKAVPLIHGIAKRLGQKRYVVCRKSIKPYMVEPIVLKPLPHFPKHVQPLVINKTDADFVRGKRVVIVDDVISTGVTMRHMKKLMEQIGADVILCAAVLKQGEQFDTLENLYYLAELPIFPKSV